MAKDVLKALEKLHKEALSKIEDITSVKELESFQRKYLARKGELNDIFKGFVDLGDELRKDAGELGNTIKQELEDSAAKLLQTLGVDKKEGDFDATIPGTKHSLGTIHPLTQFIDKITDIFSTMGFEIIEDREVETSEYNFDKLNIPPNHPARDMWDTFYVKEGTIDSELVLRTHTSPVQVRAMEKRKPPVRLVVPGRVYRHEATDASHETNFYQLEGLVIDKNISVAHLIYTVREVLKRIFGENVKIRIRPSFFPFVEPGHEVDMSCIICDMKGCSVCSRTGWLEMMGAGMVHPNVLEHMGVDPEKHTGFAFGMGIDRLMMLYYGVDDIRLSYSGDLRFLKQF